MLKIKSSSQLDFIIELCTFGTNCLIKSKTAKLNWMSSEIKQEKEIKTGFGEIIR